MTHERLLLKFLENTMTDDERKVFVKWMEQSRENRQVVDHVRRLWEAGQFPETLDFETPKEWNRLKDAMHEVPREQGRRSVLRPYFNAAAAVLILAISGFLLYLVLFKPKMVDVSTTSELKEIALPDGSQITVNRNTRISYARDFTDNRAVRLEGEAFFDVEADARHPFVIETTQATVTVVGTSFNVKSANESTEVLVVSGSVWFADIDNPDDKVVVGPGFTASLGEIAGPVRLDSTDENMIAWKSRKFTFRKTPLGKVFKSVAAYFDADITVSDADILRCRFTGSFTDPTLDEVIETLREALDLDVEVQGKHYVFSGQGCDGQ